MGDLASLTDYGEVISFGSNTATTLGTAITASVTDNTMGSWSELVASTSVDMAGFVLNVGVDTINQEADFLMDIGVGGAGSEEIIFNKFLFSFSDGHDLRESLKQFFVPIEIPSGTRVAARIQSTTGTNVALVSLSGAPSSFLSPILGQEVISIGENTADSGGTSMDPGGTAHTKGGYTEITSSLSEDVQGIFMACGNKLNGAQRINAFMYDIGVGGSGSEEEIITNGEFRMSQGEWVNGPWSFFPISIAAGTRIAINLQSADNNAADRVLDYVLYGVR